MSDFQEIIETLEFSFSEFRRSSLPKNDDLSFAEDLGLMIIDERRFSEEFEKQDEILALIDDVSKRHLRRLKDIEVAVMRVKCDHSMIQETVEKQQKQL